MLKTLDHLPTVSHVSQRLPDVRTLPRYAPTMKRYGVTEGTRDEILAELDTYGKDRLQQGKTDVAEAFAEAWREVRDGATWVEVGSGAYRVVEG